MKISYALIPLLSQTQSSGGPLLTALFTLGLLTGLIMCIPLGPLNIWVIKCRLNEGPTEALAMACGGVLVDALYFFAILSGLGLLNLTLEERALIKYFGQVILITLGLKDLFFPLGIRPSNRSHLLSRPQKNGVSEKTEESTKPIGITLKDLFSVDIFKNFFKGLFLSLANPTLIFSLSALGAFIKSLEVFEEGFLNHALFSLALFLGALSWFAFIIKCLEKAPKKITENHLKWLNRILGGLLTTIGVGLFFK